MFSCGRSTQEFKKNILNNSSLVGIEQRSVLNKSTVVVRSELISLINFCTTSHTDCMMYGTGSVPHGLNVCLSIDHSPNVRQSDDAPPRDEGTVALSLLWAGREARLHLLQSQLFQ